MKHSGDIFLAPPKDKIKVARGIEDIKAHKYKEVYNGDFSLYIRLVNHSSNAPSLYLLYEGWMLRVGYAAEQDEIVEKLSAEGTPDYRRQMESEVERCV